MPRAAGKDYVFTNKDDTVRLVVFAWDLSDPRSDWQPDLWWDYDIWERDADAHIGGRHVGLYSKESGTYFRLKRDAMDHIEAEYGTIYNISPRRSVIDGW